MGQAETVKQWKGRRRGGLPFLLVLLILLFRVIDAESGLGASFQRTWWQSGTYWGSMVARTAGEKVKKATHLGLLLSLCPCVTFSLYIVILSLHHYGMATV